MAGASELTGKTSLEELRQIFFNSKPLYSTTVSSESALEGYLVIWNLPHTADPVLGSCAKGGTRITEQVSLEEIARLAKTMALKNAAAGLALGGAKTGIRANPDSPEMESRYREFVRLLRPMLREHGGPFGGFGFDIGGRPEQALWTCDELQSTKSFTGKPLHLGGTDYDREGIAGLGVAEAAATVCDWFGDDLNHRHFSVQGAGAMGAGVIRYFSQHGGTLRAVADPRLGGCHLLQQKPSEKLQQSLISMDFATSRELLQLEATLLSSLDDILGIDVDLFFPCATQDVITEKNCGQVKARYIIEGANNPSSQQAKSLLTAGGKTIIPDFLANPGGIIAAYVELQAGAGFRPPTGKSLVEHAKDTVSNRIRSNILLTLELSKKCALDSASAGELIALSRLYPNADACKPIGAILYQLASSVK